MHAVDRPLQGKTASPSRGRRRQRQTVLAQRGSAKPPVGKARHDDAISLLSRQFAERNDPKMPSQSYPTPPNKMPPPRTDLESFLYDRRSRENHTFARRAACLLG